METIQQECKKAKEDHEEARTKLDVLTEYFKGKEVEMQRCVNVDKVCSSVLKTL